MIDRFLPLRGAKIGAWTLAAITWTSAIVASRVAATPPEPADDQPQPTAETQSVEQLAAIPEAPAGGLVVIRVGAPDIQPPTVIKRVVKAAPAPAPRQKSRGS